MENVTALKITSEEVSFKLEKPSNDVNNNPKIGLKCVTPKKKKRSRIKFYRPDPYPISYGLLIGFYDK
jgi:hypothetical protein